MKRRRRESRRSREEEADQKFQSSLGTLTQYEGVIVPTI